MSDEKAKTEKELCSNLIDIVNDLSDTVSKLSNYSARLSSAVGVLRGASPDREVESAPDPDSSVYGRISNLRRSLEGVIEEVDGCTDAL